MSKKNRYGKMPNDRDRSNYNQPDPDVNQPDELPTDEEVGDPELNIKPNENVFTPNSLVYNAYGISPTTATYRILMKDLKDMFTKVCKDQIDGVDEVTAVFDPNIGEVQFFCRFNENCRHFDDHSMQNTMLSDQKSRYFSPEVKAFAKKFGMIPARDCVRDKNDKVIGEFSKFAKADKLNADMLFVRTVDRSNNITRAYSMRLSWTTLIRLIFDMDGSAFKKQFGKQPTRCHLETHFEFTKHDGHEFGRIQYLEVTKSTNGIGSSSAPRPKIGFNYREA